jgi:hypothetical protein
MKTATQVYPVLIGLITSLIVLTSYAFVSLTPTLGAPGLFKLSITPQTLTVILSGLLALLFDWFPRLAPWYEGLSRLKKQQLMLGLLALIVAAVFGGSCYGLFSSGLACSRESLPELLQIILSAAAANQAAHLLTRPQSGLR